MAAWDVDYMKGITPHPVPLPQGEGTVWHAPSAILAFPLPGGEGQGEGMRVQAPAQTPYIRSLCLGREV